MTETCYTLTQFKADLSQAGDVTYVHADNEFTCQLVRKDGDVIELRPAKPYMNEPFCVGDLKMWRNGKNKGWCEFHRNALFWPLLDWQKTHNDVEFNVASKQIVAFWDGHNLPNMTTNIKNVPESIIRLVHHVNWNGEHIYPSWSNLVLMARDDKPGRWGFNHYRDNYYNLAGFISRFQGWIDSGYTEFQVLVVNNWGGITHMADCLLVEDALVWYAPRFDDTEEWYAIPTVALESGS